MATRKDGASANTERATKPMAATVADCDRIIDAGRRGGVNVMLMFGQRFRKVNLEARRLIREGAVGRTTQIHTYALNSGGLGSLNENHKPLSIFCI